MKIEKHPWLPGVFIAVGPATVQSTISDNSVPQSYTRADGTEVQFHWVDVAIKDINGDIKTGGAMLPHNLFVKSPQTYTKDSTINVAIQLNGDGKGYCHVHLGNGRFEVSNLVSKADLTKYSIETTSEEEAPKEVV